MLVLWNHKEEQTISKQTVAHNRPLKIFQLVTSNITQLVKNKVNRLYVNQF
jgi:hypothetical protein